MRKPIPPNWKPESPLVTAADVARLCAAHRVVVLHCFAVWNGHDIVMDEQLQLVRAEFAPAIGVFALDYDDETNWGLFRQTNLVSIPALISVTDGEPRLRISGEQPAVLLRAQFQKWLAEADAAPGDA